MESMHTHFLSLIPKYYDHIVVEVAKVISKENNIELDKVISQLNIEEMKDEILKSFETSKTMEKVTNNSIFIPNIPISEMDRSNLQKLAKKWKTEKIADISGRQTTLALRTALMGVNITDKRRKIDNEDVSITHIISQIKNGTVNVKDLDNLSRKNTLELAKYYKINGKQSNSSIVQELKYMISNNPDDGLKLQIINGTMDRKTLEHLEYDEIANLGTNFDINPNQDHHKLVNELRKLTKNNKKHIEKELDEISVESQEEEFQEEEFQEDFQEEESEEDFQEDKTMHVL
jgi:hypothetical protein